MQIPDLTGTPFDAIAFDFYFSDDAFAELGPEIADIEFEHIDVWLDELASEKLAQLDLALDEGTSIRMELLVWRHDCEASARVKEELDRIAGTMNNFLRLEASVSVDASFTVLRSALPPRGIVNSMIGVRTSTGGEDLLLSGAKFSIRGFPNDSVSWFLRSAEEAHEVHGAVSRRMRESLHESLLVDALHVAETRLRRLILEQTSFTHAVGA